MLIAMYVYDGMTALDAVGPFDLLNRIPDVTFDVVGDRAGPKRARGGLTLVADRDLDEVKHPDVILIPGGGPEGIGAEVRNTRLLDWLVTNHATATWTTSVCTGALILAAAGLLEGKRATTHWRARDGLRSFGVEYVDDRVVEDGQIVTAAGVTAGLDMALLLTERIAGSKVAQAVQLSAHYDPAPPFAPIRHHEATDEILELINERLGP